MMLSSRSSAAFSLVEVALALGIAGFCLVAIFGLLPVGVNTNAATIMQTAAASAAASVVADLRATPKATVETPSPLFGLKVPAAGAASVDHTVFLRGDGSIAAASGTSADKAADLTQDPIFRATVSFYALKDKNQRNATMARVIVSWPATADPDPTQTPAKFTGAFETVTAIDRN